MTFEESFPSLKGKLCRCMINENDEPIVVLVEEVDAQDDFEPVYIQENVLECCVDKAKLRQAMSKVVREEVAADGPYGYSYNWYAELRKELGL